MRPARAWARSRPGRKGAAELGGAADNTRSRHAWKRGRKGAGKQGGAEDNTRKRHVYRSRSRSRSRKRPGGRGAAEQRR